MQDKADTVFAQLVYAVACLIHGEHPGNNTIHQRIIADALRHRGVFDVLLTAVESDSADYMESR
jgi:hypothetical protein